MHDFIPAEAFPPGWLLRKELAARGWTQSDFARILGRPPQLVSEIIRGRKRVTEQTAAEIGAALQTSALLWINMETGYQLWKVHQARKIDPGIARRAKRATSRPGTAWRSRRTGNRA